MKQYLVRDWMTAPALTIEPDTKLPDAHRLMKDKGIRRLPVVRDNKLVGMVTLGDIRGAEPSNATSLSIWEMNYLVAKLEVREFMKKQVVVINKNETIEAAAKLMLENKISGLPVVDDAGNLVGMITESDIFRLIVTYGWDVKVPV